MHSYSDPWELRSLEDIQDLEAKWERTHATSLFRISHWDPSESSRAFLNSLLTRAEWPELFQYSYPNDDEAWNAELKRHFQIEGDKGFVLTPASTNATVLMMSTLRRAGLRRIRFCKPFYYSALRVAEEWSLSTALMDPIRSTTGFHLDREVLSTLRHDEVLWITNPLYSLGAYWHVDSIAVLQSLAESGFTVVIDESLALPGLELTTTLGCHDNVWSVISPAKSICLNGAKFAAILMPSRHLPEARRWADILCGALQSSSILALNLFNSGQLTSIATQFSRWLEGRRDLCWSVIREHSHLELDENTMGHFMTCYVPSLPASMGRDPQFLENIASMAGCSLIPGNRAHMPEGWGFTFRINLARIEYADKPVLTRLSDALLTLARG